MLYRTMQRMLNNYNWDDGFVLPRKILKEPNCDLALALEVFYLADGYSYLLDSAKTTRMTEWKGFISCLYEDIKNGKYPKTNVKFAVPISRAAKYKFKTNNNIPEVFLTDLY